MNKLKLSPKSLGSLVIVFICSSISTPSLAAKPSASLTHPGWCTPDNYCHSAVATNITSEHGMCNWGPGYKITCLDGRQNLLVMNVSGGPVMFKGNLYVHGAGTAVKTYCNPKSGLPNYGFKVPPCY